MLNKSGCNEDSKFINRNNYKKIPKKALVFQKNKYFWVRILVQI